MRIFAILPAMIRRQKIARARQVTHADFAHSEESNRIDGKASLNGERAQVRGMTCVIYRYVRKTAERRTLARERRARFRTCHSCHEVINKRHPVPSRRYCARDWSTVSVDPEAKAYSECLLGPPGSRPTNNPDVPHEFSYEFKIQAAVAIYIIYAVVQAWDQFFIISDYNIKNSLRIREFLNK